MQEIGRDFFDLCDPTVSAEQHRLWLEALQAGHLSLSFERNCDYIVQLLDAVSIFLQFVDYAHFTLGSAWIDSRSRCYLPQPYRTSMWNMEVT